MGCLPLPLLFLLGCGIGWLVAGRSGAAWGAIAGALLGTAAMAWFLRAMRRRGRR